ncbi:hypothetical protein K435DRAFT_781864 [Dendrothele bispora CBS 962.96]|uniref:Uncharacterized protein n=1 Tax=Dendrothele bispora (strain CBS 962.96) TaxID=1314807 RepID=A0A4S8LJ24_DENBC|nr:hypothetical protein K435DRAFT_781864 [Dendrothele bispora CBS 962.96]
MYASGLLRIVLVALCLSGTGLAAPNPMPTRSSSSVSRSSTTSSTTRGGTSTSLTNSGSSAGATGTTTSGRSASGTGTSTGTQPSGTSASKSCPAKGSGTRTRRSSLRARAGTTICGVDIRKEAKCTGNKTFDRFKRAGSPSSNSQSQSQSQSPPAGGNSPPSGGGSNQSDDGSDTSMHDAPASGGSGGSEADDEMDTSSDSQGTDPNRPPSQNSNNSGNSGNSGNTGNSGGGTQQSGNDRSSDGDFNPNSQSQSNPSDHDVPEEHECEHTIELQLAKMAVEESGLCDILDDLKLSDAQVKSYIERLITDRLLYSSKNLYWVAKSVNAEKRRLTLHFIKALKTGRGSTSSLQPVQDNDPEKAGLWISVMDYVTDTKIANVARNVASLLPELDKEVVDIAHDAATCAGAGATTQAKNAAQNFQLPQVWKFSTWYPLYVKFIKQQAGLDPLSSDNASQGSGSMDISDGSR